MGLIWVASMEGCSLFTLISFAMYSSTCVDRLWWLRLAERRELSQLKPIWNPVCIQLKQEANRWSGKQVRNSSQSLYGDGGHGGGRIAADVKLCEVGQAFVKIE